MDQRVNVANLGEAPVIDINNFSSDGRFVDSNEESGKNITIYVWMHHLYPNVFWYTSSSFIQDNRDDESLGTQKHLSCFIIVGDKYSFCHYNESWHHSDDGGPRRDEDPLRLIQSFRRVRSDYEAEKALLEE